MLHTTLDNLTPFATIEAKMRLPLKRPLMWLALIVLAALLLRLALLPMIHHPGIGDPNHYYNLGHGLLEGRGFTIDYIWQYNNTYDTIVHPDDYWLPLTGVLAAASMAIFGKTVIGALVLFAVVGALVPVVAYYASRQFGLDEHDSLYGAALAAVVPEFVLNSLRTDTTGPNILLVGACLLLVIEAVRHPSKRAYFVAGVCAGFAYLVRSDSALAVAVAGAVVGIYWLIGRIQPRVRVLWALILPITALIVVAPWLLRNLTETGSLTTPTLSNMFFLTNYNDHYVYDTPLNLETLLASQTMGQLIGKRLFELAASAKLMLVTLDIGLPIAIAGGFLLLLARRERDKWLTILPVVLMVIAIIVVYPILVPYKSQGGSFKKAYITLIPLLIPIGVYALRQAVADVRLRTGVVAITVLLMAMNAYDLVRTQASATDNYLANVQKAVMVLETLPDTNGDGQIILMTQDPFMLRFFGYSSIMFPLESFDKTLEIADKFGVDYFLMPPARPALNEIYQETASDTRLELVVKVEGTTFEVWRSNQ